LIFNENESEAVRDRHASLQWAVLLFNGKISFQEILVDKKLKKL